MDTFSVNLEKYKNQESKEFKIVSYDNDFKFRNDWKNIQYDCTDNLGISTILRYVIYK